MRLLIPIFALACVAPASAQDRMADLTRCFATYAAGDRAGFAAAQQTVAGWDDTADANVATVIETCLALSATNIVTAEAQDAPEPTETAQVYQTYLDRISATPDAAAQVVQDIVRDPPPPAPDSAQSQALQAAIQAYVRPIPARKTAANLAAYSALAALDPGNATYTAKVAQYQKAEADAQAREAGRQKAIVGKLIKTTAEFDGSSWYRHPSSPRYQDITPYVTLYVLETGSGVRALEFFVNYTSRDGWLFVQSASVNVDGKVTRLPSARWFRDNDTEIWEWAGYRDNADMIQLARDIGRSDRAVIRFNGQQFYADHVITDKEKRVIRDMLVAWDQMR